MFGLSHSYGLFVFRIFQFLFVLIYRCIIFHANKLLLLLLCLSVCLSVCLSACSRLVTSVVVLEESPCPRSKKVSLSLFLSSNLKSLTVSTPVRRREKQQSLGAAVMQP